MNILITNDDGPRAPGLGVLRDAVKKNFRSAQVVTMVPLKSKSGTSMSVTLSPDLGQVTDEDMKPIGTNCYAIKGTPMDCVILALHRPELFLTGSQGFDVVMSGVNACRNVGMDVFFSGTCGPVMLATSAYGISGFAFSQDIEGVHPLKPEETTRDNFKTADKLITQIMNMVPLTPGDCWNVNFPAQPAKDVRIGTPVAHYSSWIKPSIKNVPRARNEQSDVIELQKDHVTVSRLDLRVNPPLRY